MKGHGEGGTKGLASLSGSVHVISLGLYTITALLFISREIFL